MRYWELEIESRKFRQGYAALTLTVLVIFASLAVIGGLAFFSLQEVGVNRVYTTSVAAHYISEAGTEDALYRVLAGKQIASTQNLGVGTGATTIFVTTNPDGSKILRSQGAAGVIQQNTETRVGIMTDAIGFFYGIQVDEGGVNMNNGATVNGNIFSNGSVSGGTITGSATVASGIGGVNTQIANATVGTSARAPQFVNTSVGGSDCPNANCVVASDPPEALPVSDGVIQDWRDQAASSPGHICGIADGCDSSGNLNVPNGDIKTIGPLKIPGKLTFGNNTHLTIAGTVWVGGDADFSNGCAVALGSGYGATSGVIVTDGTVSISNNCTFLGSGTQGSYLMILGAKNDPVHRVMDISNNSTGVIYYAPHGRIHLHNNAAAREVAAYGIDLDNNATVTYDSGLQNVNFSSGPSAGYDVKYWKEVE